MLILRRIAKAIRSVLIGTNSEKRRIKQEIANRLANLFGDFQLSEDYKLWRTDKKFIEDFKRLSPHNLYSQDRKFTLREFVRSTGYLDASLAECGCYQGASAYFMAEAGAGSTLHLFDSFEGLSKPDEHDLASDNTPIYWHEGDLRTNESIVRNVLAGFDNVKFHKGWIPEKFKETENEKFRVVHIDVDLYQPTKDSLEYFYPRMIPGGVIVMDDFGFTSCPGAHKAATEFMKDKKQHIIHLPTGQGIILL